MNNLIKKQAHAIYTYLHEKYPHCEDHHVNGRRGVFEGCKLLIVPLSPIQHQEEHKHHRMRTANMDIIREIRKWWSKREGCTFIHDKKCLTCPLLSESLKQTAEMEENKVISEFYSHF